MKRRVAIALSTLVGAIVPLRPFLTNLHDPASEGIDLLLSPGYIVGRFLPPMSDTYASAFYIALILFNALLYGLLAHLILRRIPKTLD